MAEHYHIANDTAIGAIGGTIVSVFAHIDSADVLRTIVLGALGAVASFVASHACKWLWNKFMDWKKKE